MLVFACVCERDNNMGQIESVKQQKNRFDTDRLSEVNTKSVRLES